jgi:hypothetical protein
MGDNQRQPTHSGTEQVPSPPRMYSPTLQPLLQSLLATVANMDFEYERERDRLSASARNANLKVRVLEKLKRQHREQREPYIQQLAILQERMRSGGGSLT